MPIRKLRVADLFIVVDMLSKLTGNAGTAIDKMMTAGTGEASAPGDGQKVQIGLTVLQTLYTSLREDMTKWLASLYGVTTEQFLEMPIDTVLEAFEYLTTSEDAKSFFSKAWAMYRKIQSFAPGLKEKLSLSKTTSE